MRNSFPIAAVLVFAIATSAARAQATQKPEHKVVLQSDAPLKLISDDWDTSETPQGGALSVNVRETLVFSNASQRHIHGVTLSVVSQEVTPGGKGSVSLPSMNIGPNETFPVNVNLHLLRPIGVVHPIEVQLDGVLYDDLSFYGLDKLHSRRTMTVMDLQARRDRLYFKKLLETAGSKALQDGMIASLTRQAQTGPSPGVQVLRARATNADPEREVR